MYDTIIELKVRNHPGVMSQITGLFARRSFNLEGIFCAPEGRGTKSRMILMIYKNKRMDQVVKQLEKLYDVLSVSVRPARDPERCNWLNDRNLDRSDQTLGDPIPHPFL